jgi:molybdopterin-synthase adenylyltransferase
MINNSRYNRQELLSFIGREGQEKLSKSIVVVIGLGAIGTVTAGLLARSGIGNLILVDRDIVSLDNLQRQTLYDETDIGKPKALAASDKLKKINSDIEIKALLTDIDYKNIEETVGTPNIVLDCTDNLEVRFLINEYCLKNKLSWIHAAAIRETAQLIVFNPDRPCFECIFGKSTSTETCDTVGVLNTATAEIATVQTTEAVKLLTGKESMKEFLRLNVLQHDLTKLNVKKNSNCESCKGNYEYLSGQKGSKTIKLCGKGIYQIKGKSVNLKELKERIANSEDENSIKDFGKCISFKNITVFDDGRTLIKASSSGEARSVYSSYLGH